jgi:DNA-binding response OmpR family regulator
MARILLVDSAPAETASFTVDLPARRVSAGGTPVRLSPREWQVLEMLARHPGTLVTQRRLPHDIPASGTGSNPDPVSRRAGGPPPGRGDVAGYGGWCR